MEAMSRGIETTIVVPLGWRIFFFFFLEFFERFYDRVDRARGVSRGLSILIFRFRFRLER